MTAVRSVAKKVVDLAAEAVEPLLRARRRTVVLCYHRISHPDLFDPFPQPVSTVDRDELEKQLRWLGSFADFVTVGEVARNPHQGKRTRVAVTFDDGYRDNYSLGNELFSGLGIPVTWFIASDYVANRYFIPWWDLVSWLRSNHLSTDIALNYPDGGHAALTCGDVAAQQALAARIEKTAREQTHSELLALCDAVLAGLREVGMRLMNQMTSPQELQRIAKHDNWNIACHTASHPNMARISVDVQRDEILRGRDQLNAWGLEPRPWFAFPFGKAWARQAASVQVVAEAGFDCAVTTDMRSVPSQVNRFLVPRISVDGRWDLDRFRSRVLLT